MKLISENVRFITAEFNSFFFHAFVSITHFLTTLREMTKVDLISGTARLVNSDKDRAKTISDVRSAFKFRSESYLSMISLIRDRNGDYGDNFGKTLLISFHLPQLDEKFESLTLACQEIEIEDSRKFCSFEKFSRELSVIIILKLLMNWYQLRMKMAR